MARRRRAKMKAKRLLKGVKRHRRAMALRPGGSENGSASGGWRGVKRSNYRNQWLKCGGGESARHRRARGGGGEKRA